MGLKLILFDLMGTLLPEEGEWEALDRVLAEAAQRWALDADPADLAGAFTLALMEIVSAEGAPEAEGSADFLPFEAAAKAVFAGLLAAKGHDATGEDLEWFWDRYTSAQRETWRLYPETDEVLTALRDRGLRVGIVTDADRALATMVAPLVNLGEWVEFILTSEEVGYVKPNPRLFAAALKRAGVEPEEAAMVGDSYERDLVGAMEAGIRRVVLVDRHDARTVEVPRVRTLKGVLRHLVE